MVPVHITSNNFWWHLWSNYWTEPLCYIAFDFIFLNIFGEEEIGAMENFLRDSYLCTGPVGKELQRNWCHVLNPGTGLFCVLRTFHQFSYSSVTEGDNPSCCKSWWSSVASAHVHSDLSKHEVVQQIRGGPGAFGISCKERALHRRVEETALSP